MRNKLENSIYESNGQYHVNRLFRTVQQNKTQPLSAVLKVVRGLANAKLNDTHYAQITADNWQSESVLF